MIKKEGLEKAGNEFIECLIYRRMWDSDRWWKTAAEVRRGVKQFKYNKDKDQGLKDNIMMRFKGFG